MNNFITEPMKIRIPENDLLEVTAIGDGEVTILLSPSRMEAIEEDMKETIGKTEMYDALAILSQFGINVAGWDCRE